MQDVAGQYFSSQGIVKLEQLGMIKNPWAIAPLQTTHAPLTHSSHSLRVPSTGPSQGGGCHIQGIKRLAPSQTAYNGKGAHETPCTHNAAAFLNKRALETPLAVHGLMA